MPGSPILVLGLGQAQPALAAGEERGDDLAEVLLDGGEGLLEAALDRLGQVAAQLLELLEAPLEVAALRRELVEALLLGLVLLLRERVHLAELLAAPVEALEPRGQLLGVVTLGGFGSGRVETAAGLLDLGAGARELDVDRREPLGRLDGRAAEVGFLCAEAAQLGAERRPFARPRCRRPGGAAPRAVPARRRARRTAARRSRGAGGGRQDRPGRVRGRARLRRSGRRPPPTAAASTASSARAASPSSSAARARRRASSSSRTASAVSPANQSSPRIGSQPIPSSVTAGTGEARSSPSGTTRSSRTSSRGSRSTRTTTEPSPAARTRSTSSRAPTASAASTAEARCPSAAATARSAPGSAASIESASRSPDSARARAAGGKPFPLDERPLERGEPLACELDASGQVIASTLGLVGGTGERGRARRGRFATHGVGRDRRQVGAQTLGERLGRLAAKGETLALRAEPVERRRRALSRPGGVRQLLLGARARRQQVVEPRVALLPRRELVGAAMRQHRRPCREPREVERRERRLDPRDLLAEAHGPLGGGRLQRQRAETLAHLLLEISGALDLDRDAGELQLGPMPAQLEPPEPGCLLDEGPPLARLGAEHRLDASLRDHRAQSAAEPDVGEELDEVEPAHGRTVDEVLSLAAAVEPPRQRYLAEGKVGPDAVLVVEDELDLAEVGRPCGRRSRRTGRRRASRPGARVGSASRSPRGSRRRCSTYPSRSDRRRPRPRARGGSRRDRRTT